MHHASAVGAETNDDRDDDDEEEEEKKGIHVRENVGGIAMLAVDKGFSLFVAVARDGAALVTIKVVVVCMGCNLRTYP